MVALIELSGEFHLPMPKMGASHMARLGRELAARGFDVKGGRGISARRGGQRIRLDPAGVCWSNRDPTDLVVPSLPAILDMPRPLLSIEECRRMYYSKDESGRKALVRLETRLECSKWHALRREGLSALTPDEREVASFIVGASGAPVSVVTDFPGPTSREIRARGRRYFEASLPPKEAADALRSTSSKGRRNTYLSRSGVLELLHPKEPGRDEFHALGDWFLFSPRGQKL